MKEITCWQSDDGQLFHDKSSCARHESDVAAARSATAVLREGRSLYDAFDTYYNGCGFMLPSWPTSFTDSDQAFLQEITQNTKIAIPHWQCRDEPRYSPYEISHNGMLYVATAKDVPRGWPLAYGNWCTLRDFLRYVTETKTQHLQWHP